MRRHSRRWWTFALSWIATSAVAIALGRSVTSAFRSTIGGGHMVPRLPPPPPDVSTLLYQLGVGSVFWYTAAIAAPLLVLLARRVDAERLGLLRTATVTAAATIVMGTITAAIDYGSTWEPAARPSLTSYALTALRQHGLPWVALMGVVVAIEARRRATRSIIEREQLRTEVAKQRLLALTGQLRPHFLFNALQAVSTLIHRDPAAADDMLMKLSDLLDEALRHRESAFVPLADEIHYTRTWLEIARVRFGRRLAFAIDVPDELNTCSVPLFILQPLLENALSHGVGAVLDGGQVTVRARRSGSRLILTVADDGAGLPPESQRRQGIGLTNTRDRLAAAFGTDARLTLTSDGMHGTTAEIDMPAMTARAAPYLP